MFFNEFSTDDVFGMVRDKAVQVVGEVEVLHADGEEPFDYVSEDELTDMVVVFCEDAGAYALDAVKMIVHYGCHFEALHGDIEWENSPQKLFERDVLDLAKEILEYDDIRVI